MAERHKSVPADRAVAQEFESLSRDRILSSIDEELKRHITRLEVVPETDSTNDVILRTARSERDGYFLLAEHQTAGKGRKGRPWYSPPGGNIYLSFGWRFERIPGAFSLLVGVCVCRALARFGLAGHGIKWPNDVLVNGRKLVGILVETSKSHGSGDVAVTGIGINLAHEAIARGHVNQPWTDLFSELGAQAHARNRLVALVIGELLEMLVRHSGHFEDHLAESWPQWDVLAGMNVRVTREAGALEGRAAGITRAGGLCVEMDHTSGAPAGKPRVVVFNSGEASVRYA